MEQYRISPQKRWGQNFLIDRNHALKIVNALAADDRSAGGRVADTRATVTPYGQPSRDGNTVWEVGSGFGALTELLFELYGQLTLFEIDFGLIGYLKQRWPSLQPIDSDSPAALRLANNGDAPSYLVSGDAVSMLPRLLAHNRAPNIVVGNLPYRCAAQLLLCCALSS